MIPWLRSMTAATKQLYLEDGLRNDAVHCDPCSEQFWDDPEVQGIMKVPRGPGCGVPCEP